MWPNLLEEKQIWYNLNIMSSGILSERNHCFYCGLNDYTWSDALFERKRFLQLPPSSCFLLKLNAHGAIFIEHKGNRRYQGWDEASNSSFSCLLVHHQQARLVPIAATTPARAIPKLFLYLLYAHLDWNSCGPITPPSWPMEFCKPQAKAVPVAPLIVAERHEMKGM